MKNWFRFVWVNKRILNFGFVFSFFTAFGQTFFIALFFPIWVKSFHISNATFGTLYALATIASAFLLSFLGKYIDRMPLRKFGAFVFCGLMISVLLLSFANHIVVLTLGLLMVRLFGQGLMTHTSTTGIAKFFNLNRGKALGVTSLGHPAGQFLIPLLAVPLIAYAGWRTALLVIALAAIAIIIPSLLAMNTVKDNISAASTKVFSGKAKSHVMCSPKFWIIALNVFSIPFVTTSIFLYQYNIGICKGWDGSWLSFSFLFYAVFNAFFLFFAGNLVDKFSGRVLFPIYPIPAIIALLLMFFVNSLWIGPVFYSLLGISSGLASTIKTDLFVEVYGSDNLGEIRSYFTTIMVLSTALGPAVFGYLLDGHISLNTILGVSGIAIFVITIISMKVWRIKENK